MSLINRLFLFFVTISVCVGLDQATKKLAVLLLKGKEPMSFLADTFRLEYAENTGAFLSLGANLPDWERWLILTVISGLVLVALAFFVAVRKNLPSLEITGYSLIIAGGASNMIDRIMAGAVVDFLNMGVGPVRTGIFNVADVVIMAGLGLVILVHLRGEGEAPSEPSVGERQEEERREAS